MWHIHLNSLTTLRLAVCICQVCASADTLLHYTSRRTTLCIAFHYLFHPLVVFVVVVVHFFFAHFSFDFFTCTHTYTNAGVFVVVAFICGYIYFLIYWLVCLFDIFFAPSQPRRHTAAHWRWFRPLYRGATVLRWHYGAVHFHNHCGSLNTRTRTTGIALALTCSSTCTSHYIRLIRSSAVVVDDGDVCCCRQRCSTECSKCVNPTKCDTKLRRRQKAHNV